MSPLAPGTPTSNRRRSSCSTSTRPSSFKYTENEGDLITISTDSELDYAIAHATTPEKPILHLTLETAIHTAAHLATRTTTAAAAHMQPAAEPSAALTSPPSPPPHHPLP